MSLSAKELFRRRAVSDLEIDTSHFHHHSTRAITFTSVAVLSSAAAAVCYWRRDHHIGNTSMVCTVLAVMYAGVHSRQADYHKSRMEEAAARHSN